MRKSQLIFNFLFSFLLFLSGCVSHTARISKTETNALKLTAESPEDPVALSLIEPYKSVLEKEMNQVLIISESEAIKGQPEGKLGNIIADITLEASNKILLQKNQPPADICMLNNGGLRTSLPKGEITMGKIFELMPFENEIVVLTLNGQNTLELLKYIARAKGVPVSGLKMGIRDEEPVNILVQGLGFDPQKTYRIVTSDYLANGGDRMNFFSNPEKKEKLNKKLRDAIAEHMITSGKEGKTLQPKLDGRIYNE